jgi:hypothetical protein
LRIPNEPIVEKIRPLRVTTGITGWAGWGRKGIVPTGGTWTHEMCFPLLGQHVEERNQFGLSLGRVFYDQSIIVNVQVIIVILAVSG